jgi:2-oxoglutarate dehydrogenase E2 component (dihydrolipoamide succinyltransferase)
MAKEIKIPTVGESITEVVVSTWLKKSGDTVEMDEPIAEIESDKATVELMAEADGVLETLVEEGDTVAIGAVVAKIDESGASTSAKPVDTAAQAAPASQPAKGGEVVDIKVPTVGESITQVVISSWIKNTGDTVEMDEPIAEIESDKATVELMAEADGVLETIASEGDTVDIGAVVAKITKGAGAPAASSTSKPVGAAAQAAPASQSANTYASGHASPAAAKILAEKGIDASSVKGTGKDGRVTKEDAMNASAKPAAIAPAKSDGASQSAKVDAQVPKRAGEREVEKVKMSPLRKTIARRLVEAKHTTAMLTTFNEVDMHAIMQFRKKYQDEFVKKHDIKLGFMSLFTKALCKAAEQFPGVNGQIVGDHMHYHNYCDVGIAVSTPKGLVVPVVRNAESLELHQIEKEIKRLAIKGRDGKLSMDEMQGGTITITNGGVFGSMLSTPIINIPQSAILGMHNIVERPVAVNGQVVVHPVMYLALSYDHRIVDGRESVGCLKAVKEYIEDPAKLILDL